METVTPVVALLDFPGRYNAYGLRAVPYQALGLRVWDVYRDVMPASASPSRFLERVLDEAREQRHPAGAVVASCASAHWAVQLATAYGGVQPIPPRVVVVNPGVPTEQEIIAEVARVFDQLGGDPKEATAAWRQESAEPGRNRLLRARALKLLGVESEADIDASLRQFVAYQLGWIYYLTAGRASACAAAGEAEVDVLAAEQRADKPYGDSVAEILERLDLGLELHPVSEEA